MRPFYKIIRSVLKFLMKLLYNPKIIGIENIPKEGGIVLAGNHTKWLDPLLLISIVDRQIHFLAKKELFFGITKIFMKQFNCIPVDRKIHDKEALQKAYDVLNDRKVIGIFPEGTINRSNDVILPFKIGAVKMAKETNSYLIPFVITGKYNIFKRNICIEFLEKRKVSSPLEEENKYLEKIITRKLDDKNECN